MHVVKAKVDRTPPPNQHEAQYIDYPTLLNLKFWLSDLDKWRRNYTYSCNHNGVQLDKAYFNVYDFVFIRHQRETAEEISLKVSETNDKE